MKKSWQQKIEDKLGYPKVLRLEKGFPCYNAVHKLGAEAGDDVVIVNASEIASVISIVPRGKLLTLAEICRKVAKNHNVVACCTLVAGIHVMSIANAVVEAEKEGKYLSIPYWRTLKIDGSLNQKYPGGVEAQKKMLEDEGFEIVKKGGKYFVKNFQKFVFVP